MKHSHLLLFVGIMISSFVTNGASCVWNEVTLTGDTLSWSSDDGRYSLGLQVEYSSSGTTCTLKAISAFMEFYGAVYQTTLGTIIESSSPTDVTTYFAINDYSMTSHPWNEVVTQVYIWR